MAIKVDIVAPHNHTGAASAPVVHPPALHEATHETGGSDELDNLAASVITSGTLDGDRLPAISTTKKGAVPLTGAPANKYLRDDDAWMRPTQNEITNLETTATPQFAGLGIKTPGSDNRINLIEGAIVGVAAGPYQKFNAAAKLLEMLGADINIGDTPTQPGTSGTWSLSYDSTATTIFCQAVFLGKLYVGISNGDIYVFDGTNWSLSYDSPSAEIYSLCVFNGKLYAGGYRAGASPYKYIYVFDGNTWETAFAATSSNIPQCFALCVLGDTLYAGFREGTFGSPGYADVIKTTNGIDWFVSKNRTTSVAPRALAVFNGALYAAGEYNGIWKLTVSTGVWAQVDATAIFWRALYVWNNKIYAGGASGKIFVSSNGTTWTEAIDLGASAVYFFIEHNAKLLASHDGDLYGTDNGSIWTLFYDSPEVTIHSLILFGTGLYAGTGNAGKVLAYLDNTYIPAPNLQVFGHQRLWGQFRPGDAVGQAGDPLVSGGNSYPTYVAKGAAGTYFGGSAALPLFKAIPASDVVNTPAGAIAAVTVQAAINELDTEKQSIAGLVAAFKSSIAPLFICNQGEVVVNNGEVVYGT